MKFSLKTLLLVVTGVAALLAITAYASRHDGLTIAIAAATLIVHVVVPAAAIATAIGYWRRNRRLAITGASILGLVIGLVAGGVLKLLIDTAASIFADAAPSLMTRWPTDEAIAIVLLPTSAIMGGLAGWRIVSSRRYWS